MNENVGQSFTEAWWFSLGLDQSLVPQVKRFLPFCFYMKQVIGKKWGTFICLFLFSKILVSVIVSLRLQKFWSNVTTVKEIETILFTGRFSSQFRENGKSQGKWEKKNKKPIPGINRILRGTAVDSLSLWVEGFNFINLHSSICSADVFGSHCYNCSFSVMNSEY